MNRRGFLGGVVALLGFRGPTALLEGPAEVLREGDLVGGRAFLGVDYGRAEATARVVIAMTPLGEVLWMGSLVTELA